MDKKLEELLLTVRKPGRYIGGEWNAVKKVWTDARTTVLLAFPDTYEVGMSYLGMKILYGILNDRDDCLCERVFAPWPDFEKVLRENNISLFSLESRKPIREFDIIGFSLAFELGYTNVLNILDLGGIPVRSSARSDDDPIIIAGGPSCYNPEPMAEFIDAFIIGDGEEVIAELIDAYKEMRGAGGGVRGKILKEFAKIKGVYVPSLYKVEYNNDGTISRFTTAEDGVSAKIEKRIVKDLDKAFYPTKQIVPNVQIVHDRIAIEIMRGCKHACNFCQASATYRPCRERSKEAVLELAKEAYAMTGYDEISLLSLSSGDYSCIMGVIEELNKEFSKKYVSISVPSLRIEGIAKELPDLISKVKKAGLTFAPEAGSEDLRKVLRKDIDIEKLFLAAMESFKRGWKRVKLYFMIGLPGENEKNIMDIAELVHKISELKRQVDHKPAAVAVSINAFVPKPHTPFQWKAMDRAEELEGKRTLLRNNMRSRLTELSFHPFKMSYIEAVLSRGDRRVSDAILGAWKNGARFDGWQDVFDFNTWASAFRSSGIDADFYVYRTREMDEVLPWDFIDVGLKKEILLSIFKACQNPII